MTMELILHFAWNSIVIPYSRCIYAKIFFIVFVDAIFTTLFQRLFTNTFDVSGAGAANSCV
jgi:hypothetical protein